ncbi:MAG: YgaP family membrane protein [Gammaproteobacteria bacterium]
MSFDYKRLVKFEHNVGENDKKYRMIGGSILVVVSLFTAKIPLILLGMVLIATAYTGWCPVYSGFGKNTCGSGESSQPDTSKEDKSDSES